MVTRPISLPISLRIDQPSFELLYKHLFPGDGDEHGAVISAGVANSPRGTRLLVRDVIPALDGIDYVPGTRGYRALSAEFVAKVSDHCARENLAYLAVHNHGGADAVAFSPDDLASHERGYPALLEITHGGPVGAIVLAEGAVAGDVWTPDRRSDLSHMTVLGSRIRTLYPAPIKRPTFVNTIYDRHARLFGNVGQEILSSLKVGIIGLGGGGSLLNEWLARLGVGHIVAVDFDKVEVSNLARIVGATERDAAAFLSRCKSPSLRALGEKLARHKVDVARRVARQANPAIRYNAVKGNILDEPTARLLIDADFLFLATDSIQSRLVFNALVHQYLIPGIQIGAKVQSVGGYIGDITAVTRPVLPYAGGGCLDCGELIPPARLQEEALSERERHQQRYIDDDSVSEPSVITLNAMAAARAVNDMMMMATGLFCEDVTLLHLMEFVRERQLSVVESRFNAACLDCGCGAKSRRARGDRARLPCRETRYAG